MSFGDVLKKIRIKHNDTLQTLADKLQVAQSYVSKIEKTDKISEKMFLTLLELYPDSASELSLAYLDEKIPQSVLENIIYKNDKEAISFPMMKAKAFLLYRFNAVGDGTLIKENEQISLMLPAKKVLQKDTFCIKIFGDEIEPIFYDEDILLVENTVDTWQELNKKVVVIENNGHLFIRKVEIVDYKPYFYSLNNLYPPIEISEDIKYIGRITCLLNRKVEKIK